MKFKQFFQLFLDSKQIQDELRDDISSNELWTVAKDIRRYPFDYKDTFDFGTLIHAYGKSDSRNYGKEFFDDYRGNILYIPYENQKKIFKDHNRGIVDFWSYYKHDMTSMTHHILRDKYLNTAKEPLFRNINLKNYILPMGEDEYKKLLKDENITVPDIYKHLLNVKFNLPKTPEEIDPKFRNLPRSILNAIYIGSKSPVQIAIISSNLRNRDDNDYDNDYDNEYYGSMYYGSMHNDIAGPSGIINILEEHEFGPTKKEAYEWLTISAKNRHIVNWPSFMLQNVDKNVPEVSITSFAVFRWFLNNLKSKFLTKSQTIYGPAGQTNTFIPMDHITQITTEDLENGVKTSPEKVFNNAAQRLAKTNKHTFGDWAIPSYKSLFGVKVIHSQTELDHEGQRMRHCVGGYGKACELGQSLILSLPNSTAEINPKTLVVYQHRGLSNASPPEKDQELLTNWIQLQRT
jgi:hypothetical protein